MKIKTIGVLLIAGLVVLAAMMAFTTPAIAYTDEEFENAPLIDELEPADQYPNPPEGQTRDDPRWYGNITNANTGVPMPGLTVKLYKDVWLKIPGNGWKKVLRHIGSDTTDRNGYYSITNRLVYPEGQYYLRISDGSTTETYLRYLYWRLGRNDYIWVGRPECIWTYRWDQTTEIPEFATIAIPVVAVLGLFLFYSHRKRKEE